jgi:sterol desaturase/sphingolipid hydroxylase (fatty acid hydroxylase superfamily)
MEYPDKSKLWNEFKWSAWTLVIFSLTGVITYYEKKAGYTYIYNDIMEYGWGYLIFSVFAMILIHDTYFYWAHRFMHLKWVFPYVHKVHHESLNPSPWAAFSFHPIEAVMEAAIVPIIIHIMPAHGIAILSFLVYMTFMNAFGHNGFEVYPSGFTKNLFTGWNNTPTHHNMHHRYFNCNYGLYFNWWDKICGTNHEKYHETFEAVKARS